jgi:signal transduction histidine kinase/ligand-binding sensor domain-containing protein
MALAAGWRRGGVRLLALLALGSPALALDPSLPFRQLLHDTWSDAAGLSLGGVTSAVQGADGYLWIGGAHGLLRFDGLRFTAPFEGGGLDYQWPKLAATPDGAIWITQKEGLARVLDAVVRKYPTVRVAQIVAAPNGKLWSLHVDASVSLIESPERPPRRFGAADGLPAGRIETISADGEGLWMGGAAGVCRWAPRRPARCVATPAPVFAIAATGPDEVYAAGTFSVVRVAGGRVETIAADLGDRMARPGVMLADRDGGAWLGTTGGLLRIRGGASEWFTRKDGLSADSVNAIVEDTEGDVWVATPNGVDRFRPPRVLHLSPVDGLSTDTISALEATPDGAVWIATDGGGLNRWKDGRITVYSLAQGLPGRMVRALHADRRGVLWVAASGGVARIVGGAVRSAWPGAGDLRETFSMADDVAGNLWLADQRAGVWRFDGARAVPVPAPIDQVFRVAASSDGAVWLGSYSKGVARLCQGGAEVLPRIAPGPVRAIAPDESGAVWIGAGTVLARVRNGKTTAWGPRLGLATEEILGIADDRRGGLWVVTPESVSRIARDDLDKSADGLPGTLRPARYDRRDGLRLRSIAGMPSGRIAAAPDGRIWAIEQDGVAILDPELLRPDTVTPPVHVEAITVDGATLPAGTRRYRGHETRITYTALSLRAPERLSFRYRMDPGVSGWTEAENRRDVTFVNLPPDHYRFRVTACNLDDVCNLQGDTIEFDVAPYFYQTIWAKLLWLGLTGMFGWGAYRLRLQQMQSRFRLAAQERARVTREIHDTLLQGFAGVVYQLEAASRQFETRPADSRQRLERAISQADTALTEARRTLQDMRLPVLEDRTLPEALEEAGAQAAAGLPAAFQVRVKGRVTPLPYPAQAAMFLIGREAVNNAINHANAGRITVHLVYADREFRMTIHDDGASFDPQAAKQKTGHFGVSSMEERARQVGADFRIDSAPGRGSTITVTIGRK